ncbi:hypothetical protein HYH03_018549 [Edaphochlamys debaryana]|uniref:Uncharacterized protein n=1 Tax=Edaphochlamys debaryana TaxID=47281 RepID=A0A835XFM9_9CHLO|nr:hypothetical protein HYH03_018549 [Edaphochlamys debaryana]|eukprot:KAG2482504.1 hypothetical protein HYH03_018549 [Edaphochlamys debaryana]
MAQGVTAKVTDSTSAVLCNHELLASITGVLKRRYEKTRNLRAVCTGIRDAYDQGLERLGLESSYQTAEELLSFCARLVERGCRPKSISIRLDTLPAEDKEVKDELAAQSLVALAGSRGVLATTALAVTRDGAEPGDRGLPSPALGRAIAATMPSLEGLDLHQLRYRAYIGDEELPGLEALPAVFGEDGEGTLPVLGSLKTLSLPKLDSLPPFLPACKQLRSLSLDIDDMMDMQTMGSMFQQLGELPSLRYLSIDLNDSLSQAADLPLELLTCLTNLTTLGFGLGDQQDVTTSELAGLTGLVVLNLNSAPVSVEALCGLSALTSVTMGTLCEPCGGDSDDDAGGASNAPSRRWALPPSLESISVSELPELRLLAALQPGPAFRELYMRNDHYPPELVVLKEDSDGEGRLLPSSEASLIEAARFLGRWFNYQSYDRSNSFNSLRVQFWRKRPHCLGGCVAGPGQPPSHSRWLAAVAEANPGLSHLQLEGIALSAEDVETIAARFTSLKELHLLWPTTLPPAALPLLARMPQLQRLALSVFGLCHGTAHPGEAAEGQGDQLSASEERLGEALGALARLYSEGGYGGSLCVQHRERCEGAEGRLRGLLSAAGVELGEGPSDWAVHKTELGDSGEAFYVHRA